MPESKPTKRRKKRFELITTRNPFQGEGPMLWELSIFIFTFAFLLFTLFSIRYLVQLRRTAKNIEIVLDTFNQHLPGIMEKIDLITRDISETVLIVKTQTSLFSSSAEKIKKAAEDILDFERSIRMEIESPIMQIVGTYSAVVKGVRAFISALISRS